MMTNDNDNNYNGMLILQLVVIILSMVIKNDLHDISHDTSHWNVQNRIPSKLAHNTASRCSANGGGFCCVETFMYDKGYW